MPRKVKCIHDETIIAALIAEGSVKGAAASLNITSRTLFNRMKAPEFRELYAQAKAEILRSATAKLQNQVGSAIDTIVNVMKDPQVASQTRVNAAVSVLQYASRFTETIDIIERLEAIENFHKQEEVERIKRSV